MLSQPEMISTGHIENLLEMSEKERRKTNKGYDPLATLPDPYVEGEKDVPSTEQVWEEGHRYVVRQEMEMPPEEDYDSLDFYVIHEFDTVEDNHTLMGMTEECNNLWWEIADEIYE